jgi:chromosome segregation ATPase
MSDANSASRSLRERLASRPSIGGTEDRLGKALSDLLENPVLTGVVGRAFDAREKAAQAQEVAMGALNIPSAADIERLTRRLRSVSQRLEGIEDGVHRLDRALSRRGVDRSEIGQRLSAIEDQLGTLTQKLGQAAKRAPAAKAAPRSKPAGSSKPAGAFKPAARRATKPGGAKAKQR